MFKRNEKYYALLVPYLEGGLDDVRAADLRARLAEDTALAADAERLRLTLASLRETSRRSPDLENAAVPADLWPRLRDRLEPAAPSRRTAPAGWLAAVGAAAAVAFAAIWLPVGQPREPARVVNSPRPSSAAKGPERVASAFKSEGLRPLAPALPAPAVPPPSKTVAPASAAPHPAPKAAVTPTLARPDPFAIASAGGTNARAKAAAPRNVYAQTSLLNPVAVAPSAVPSKKPSPTLMASAPRDAFSRDRSTGGINNTATGNYENTPPTSRHGSPADAPPGSSASDGLAPVRLAPPLPATAPPASAAAPSPTADQALQVQNGVGGFALGAQAALPSGVRGFAAQHGQVAGQGLSAYGNLRPERPARRSALKPQGAQAGAALQQQDAAFGAGQTLDAWQSALAQAVQPPLLGQNEGVQQANQALMSARESGNLDALRERLEARRAQSPRDLGTARMLAAVYDFAFSSEAALHERRRLVTLDGAAGEDWFALAEAEGHAGNAQAARAAYRRALDAPGPLSGFHAQIAKARG